MENDNFQWVNPLLMVIFNSYVKLPEGNYQFPCFAVCLSCHFGIDNLLRRRLRRRFDAWNIFFWLYAFHATSIPCQDIVGTSFGPKSNYRTPHYLISVWKGGIPDCPTGGNGYDHPARPAKSLARARMAVVGIWTCIFNLHHSYWKWP